MSITSLQSQQGVIRAPQPQAPSQAAQTETALKPAPQVESDSLRVSIGKHTGKSAAGVLAGGATAYAALLTPLTPLVGPGFDGLLLGGGAALGGALAGTVAGNFTATKTGGALAGAAGGAVIGAGLAGYGTRSIQAALAGAALGAISGAVSGLTTAAIFPKQ